MTARSRATVVTLGVLALAAPPVFSAATAPTAPTAPTVVAPAPTAAYDLDNGNAAVDLVIPAVIPASLTSVSPGASDASLILRITHLTTTAWFDAIAPYHPTAVGVYSDLGRRPASEGESDRGRNTALLYASYHVLTSLLPQHAEEWQQMLLDAGLDPADTSDDVTTAVGIGNRAGAAVVAAREHDGMNQLGDEPGGLGGPYADTTGYQPVNAPGELTHPGRWQPLVVTDGNGLFRSQVFVTPQWSTVQAHSYDDVATFTTPEPVASDPRGQAGRAAYKAQVDEVMAVAAGLTDEQKLAAELFDNKFRSLGFSALFVLQSRNLTLEEFVQYDFLVNVAATDAGIAIWKEKIRHDAVRPVTAIGHQYGTDSSPKGPPRTVLPGAESWTSYLATADHPEYPSGSAGFCAAHAQASRLFLGTDDLGWEVTSPPGSSVVEPGVVPAQEVTLTFETWTEFEEVCGLSRLYGGVHFRAAITEAQKMARPIGDLAFAFVQSHIDGAP